MLDRDAKDDRRHPWSAVPASAPSLIRPSLVSASDEIINAIRAEVIEYALPLDGEFGWRIRQGVTVALNQFLDLLGTDLDPPDTSIYFDLGRAEHRTGRTLDALQTAYRIGSRVAWRRIASHSDSYMLAPAAIYRLAEALFAYMERLAAASVAGYAHEQSMRAGSQQARWHTLIESMARRPPVDTAEVERLAAAAGWPLPSGLAALIMRGEASAIGRRMRIGTIWTTLDPVGVIILPDPDGPGTSDRLVRALGGQRAVLGPSVPWALAHRSIARARAAWTLHAAGHLAPDSLVRTDDHLIPLLLAADPELTADLVARRLAPLQAMSGVSRDRSVRTLRAWLDCHGDVAATAAALRVHAQTVRYRLTRLRDAFGGALEDATARLEVELALRAVDSVVKNS